MHLSVGWIAFATWLGAGEPSSAAPRDADEPWIRRLRPTPHMVEIGLHGGVFKPAADHDFYDPRTAPQKPLWAAAGDVGLRLAYLPLRFLGVEAEFSAIPTRARTLTDDRVLLWAFRGQVIAQLPWWAVTPILFGGGGAMGIRSSLAVLGDDVDGIAHWGGGLKIHATRWVSFRVDARHVLGARAARQDDLTHHLEILAGAALTLRPKTKPTKPRDRDRDGIADPDDRCPTEPGPAPTGCPDRDQDRDGVPVPADRCPDRAGPAPTGCPVLDGDGDGIPDPEDRCPDRPETRNGFEDDDGCPDELPKAVERFNGVIAGIEFEFESAEIRPSSTTTLDQALEVLKQYPDIRVEIVGHTDDVGTAEFNLDLSRRRAEAVRDHLVRGGIAPERVRARGVGPAEPIADNATEEGRARNRRIEFKILVD